MITPTKGGAPGTTTIRAEVAAALRDRAAVARALATAWEALAADIESGEPPIPYPLAQFAHVTGRAGRPLDCLYQSALVTINVGELRALLWQIENAQNAKRT